MLVNEIGDVPKTTLHGHEHRVVFGSGRQPDWDQDLVTLLISFRRILSLQGFQRHASLGPLVPVGLPSPFVEVEPEGGIRI